MIVLTRQIYLEFLNAEEAHTGVVSKRPRNVAPSVALTDAETRKEFLRQMQELDHLAKSTTDAITSSYTRLPYGIRLIARDLFETLRVQLPTESEDAILRAVSGFVYFRYINPVLIGPEAYDVVDAVERDTRHNLALVGKLLEQWALGREFDPRDEHGSQFYLLNERIRGRMPDMFRWITALINVRDPEVRFCASADFDVASHDAIYISPGDIYMVHAVLAQHREAVVGGPGDPLAVVLDELGPPPSVIDTSADRGVVQLKITTRREGVQADPEAENKALWIRTKRFVLAHLKIQSADNLELLVAAPRTQEDEDRWAATVASDLAQEARVAHGGDARLRSTASAGDLYALSFGAVKQEAIAGLVELRKRKLITRPYQAMLDDIAADIQLKQAKRRSRQRDLAACLATNDALDRKSTFLNDQLRLFNDSLDSARSTLHKGAKKQRLHLPWVESIQPMTSADLAQSLQGKHLRELKKSGKTARFGSFVFTADDLHARGILLSVDASAQAHWSHLKLSISSDEEGALRRCDGTRADPRRRLRAARECGGHQRH